LNVFERFSDFVAEDRYSASISPRRMPVSSAAMIIDPEHQWSQHVRDLQ